MSGQEQAGSLQNPRELVRWALIKGDEGDVSEVFTIGDKYVIAVLNRKKDKGLADAYDLRKDPANTYALNKIYSEKKAKIISDSLNLDKFKGMDIDKRAQAYGPSAQKGVANDVTIANSSAGIQYDPIVTGAVFGLKPGKQTYPIKGESGVAILQLIKIAEAPAIADYSTYKKSLTSSRQQSLKDYQDAEKAITEAADIEDDRIRFY
jgi:peptidyl-prolyl cis-trans isomerase D